MAKVNIRRGHVSRKEDSILNEIGNLLIANELKDIIVVGATIAGSHIIIPKDRIQDVLDIRYSSWYGDIEINGNLVILLSNGGKLNRWATEDGMEGFTYVPPPSKDEINTLIKSILIGGPNGR